jgi:hypothetical protein
MSDRDNLTTRDLAEPRSTGEETAEDSALTREDSSNGETREPAAEGASAASPTDRSDAGNEATPSLLPSDQSDRFEQRWQEIQTSFVDEPRRSVEQADTLVAELMQELAAGFSETRSGLEAQWDNDGGDVSTEDLRVALTRYRSFFNRLLSA